MSEPASIRYNNPGAMWGGAHAKKWGATDTIALNDGLGQGNTIAKFPTVVQGAAAQFDLWRKAYTGMTLAEAIKKWSGGNSSASYMAFLEKSAGIDAGEKITVALLSSGRGVSLMKAQAQWEAGKPYPMTDAQWQEAQRKVFSAMAPVPPPDIPKPKPTPQQSASSGLFSALVSFALAIINSLKKGQ